MIHKSIQYWETFPLPNGGWVKMVDEILLEPGETPRDAFYEGKKQVRSTFYEMKGQEAKVTADKVVEDKSKIDFENEQALEAVKKQIDTFQFKEDAEMYLATTDFKYNLEAKNIINKKPSKK